MVEVQENIKIIAQGQQQQVQDHKRGKLFEWLSHRIPSARDSENQR
jgi:hypothetical protein